MRKALAALLLALAGAIPVHAVYNGGGNFTDPSNPSDPSHPLIPNWNTGWTQPTGGGAAVTGWDYVGQIGDTTHTSTEASATYLGNGWVLTANHVGAGNFVLNGHVYPMIAGTAQNIFNNDPTQPDYYGQQVDLTIYRINTASTDGVTLNLPVLPLEANDPAAFAYGTAGSLVAIIGYGGGRSWGFNTVTQNDEAVTPDGYSYVSNDFLTLTGTTTYENTAGTDSQTITNNAQVVLYDSGGGDFIFNTTSGQWELAGINEVTGTVDETNQPFSGFIQLDTYAAQINAIVNPPSTDTPTLPWPALLALVALLFGVAAPFLDPKRLSIAKN